MPQDALSELERIRKELESRVSRFRAEGSLTPAEQADAQRMFAKIDKAEFNISRSETERRHLAAGLPGTARSLGQEPSDPSYSFALPRPVSDLGNAVFGTAAQALRTPEMLETKAEGDTEYGDRSGFGGTEWLAKQGESLAGWTDERFPRTPIDNKALQLGSDVTHGIGTSVASQGVGFAGIGAGAGLGAMIGGPPGAVVGGVAGALLGRGGVALVGGGAEAGPAFDEARGDIWRKLALEGFGVEDEEALTPRQANQMGSVIAKLQENKELRVLVDQHALSHGLTAGVVAGAAEQIPFAGKGISAIKNMLFSGAIKKTAAKEVGKQAAKTIFAKAAPIMGIIAEQMAREAAEEGLTEAGIQLSEMGHDVGQASREGFSWGRTGYSTLVGGLSGGPIGAVGAVANRTQGSRYAGRESTKSDADKQIRAAQIAREKQVQLDQINQGQQAMAGMSPDITGVENFNEPDGTQYGTPEEMVQGMSQGAYDLTQQELAQDPNSVQDLIGMAEQRMQHAQKAEQGGDQMGAATARAEVEGIYRALSEFLSPGSEAVSEGETGVPEGGPEPGATTPPAATESETSEIPEQEKEDIERVRLDGVLKEVNEWDGKGEAPVLSDGDIAVLTDSKVRVRAGERLTKPRIQELLAKMGVKLSGKEKKKDVAFHVDRYKQALAARVASKTESAEAEVAQTPAAEAAGTPGEAPAPTVEEAPATAPAPTPATTPTSPATPGVQPRSAEKTAAEASKDVEALKKKGYTDEQIGNMTEREFDAAVGRVDLTPLAEQPQLAENDGVREQVPKEEEGVAYYGDRKTGRSKTAEDLALEKNRKQQERRQEEETVDEEVAKPKAEKPAAATEAVAPKEAKALSEIERDILSAVKQYGDPKLGGLEFSSIHHELNLAEKFHSEEDALAAVNALVDSGHLTKTREGKERAAVYRVAEESAPPASEAASSQPTPAKHKHPLAEQLLKAQPELADSGMTGRPDHVMLVGRRAVVEILDVVDSKGNHSDRVQVISPTGDVVATFKTRKDGTFNIQGIVEKWESVATPTEVESAPPASEAATSQPPRGEDAGGTVQEGKASLPEFKPGVRGKKAKVVTPQNTKVDVEYAVVERSSLVASHAFDLSPNPMFPAELQPRDRTRAASERQITDITNPKNFDPDRLAESVEAGNGAPIVGPDGVVEAGNGRVIAVSRVYEKQPNEAAKYREMISRKASDLGVDADAVSKMKEPVLVRVRTTEMDSAQRVKFTKEANVSSVSKMSAVEQAVSDADSMNVDLMELLETDESGDLNAASNREFVRKFMQVVVPSNEQGDLLTSNGSLSQDGLKRVQNAVFARAYGTSTTSQEVLQELAEKTDGSVKNVTTALLRMAGRFASVKALMEKGDLHSLDITQEIIDTVDVYMDIKSRGQTVDAYFRQARIGDDTLTPLGEQLLVVLEKNKRSANGITRFFSNYIDTVEGVGNPKQADLFGDIEVTKEDAFAAAMTEEEAANATEQAKEAQGEPRDGEETTGVAAQEEELTEGKPGPKAAAEEKPKPAEAPAVTKVAATRSKVVDNLNDWFVGNGEIATYQEANKRHEEEGGVTEAEYVASVSYFHDEMSENSFLTIGESVAQGDVESREEAENDHAERLKAYAMEREDALATLPSRIAQKKAEAQAKEIEESRQRVADAEKKLAERAEEIAEYAAQDLAADNIRSGRFKVEWDRSKNRVVKTKDGRASVVPNASGKLYHVYIDGKITDLEASSQSGAKKLAERKLAREALDPESKASIKIRAEVTQGRGIKLKDLITVQKEVRRSLGVNAPQVIFTDQDLSGAISEEGATSHGKSLAELGGPDAAFMVGGVSTKGLILLSTNQSAAAFHAAARHETVHHARRMGILNDSDWANLQRIHATAIEEGKKIGKSEEEVLADAFGDWAASEHARDTQLKAADSIWTKLTEWLKQIGNILSDAGYGSEDHIFGSLQSGHLAASTAPMSQMAAWDGIGPVASIDDIKPGYEATVNIPGAGIDKSKVRVIRVDGTGPKAKVTYSRESKSKGTVEETKSAEQFVKWTNPTSGTGGGRASESKRVSLPEDYYAEWKDQSLKKKWLSFAYYAKTLQGYVRDIELAMGKPKFSVYGQKAQERGEALLGKFLGAWEKATDEWSSQVGHNVQKTKTLRLYFGLIREAVNFTVERAQLNDEIAKAREAGLTKVIHAKKNALRFVEDAQNTLRHEAEKFLGIQGSTGNPSELAEHPQFKKLVAVWAEHDDGMFQDFVKHAGVHARAKIEKHWPHLLSHQGQLAFFGKKGAWDAIFEQRVHDILVKSGRTTANATVEQKKLAKEQAEAELSEISGGTKGPWANGYRKEMGSFEKQRKGGLSIDMIDWGMHGVSDYFRRGGRAIQEWESWGQADKDADGNPVRAEPLPGETEGRITFRNGGMPNEQIDASIQRMVGVDDSVKKRIAAYMKMVGGVRESWGLDSGPRKAGVVLSQFEYATKLHHPITILKNSMQWLVIGSLFGPAALAVGVSKNWVHIWPRILGRDYIKRNAKGVQEEIQANKSASVLSGKTAFEQEFTSRFTIGDIWASNLVSGDESKTKRTIEKLLFTIRHMGELASNVSVFPGLIPSFQQTELFSNLVSASAAHYYGNDLLKAAMGADSGFSLPRRFLRGVVTLGELRKGPAERILKEYFGLTDKMLEESKAQGYLTVEAGEMVRLRGAENVNFRSGPGWTPGWLLGSGAFWPVIRTFKTFAYNQPRMLIKHSLKELMHLNPKPLVFQLGGGLVAAQIVSSVNEVLLGVDTDDEDEWNKNPLLRHIYGRISGLLSMGMLGILESPGDHLSLRGLFGAPGRTLERIGVSMVAMNKFEPNTSEFWKTALYYQGDFVKREIGGFAFYSRLFRSYGHPAEGPLGSIKTVAGGLAKMAAPTQSEFLRTADKASRISWAYKNAKDDRTVLSTIFRVGYGPVIGKAQFRPWVEDIENEMEKELLKEGISASKFVALKRAISQGDLSSIVERQKKAIQVVFDNRYRKQAEADPDQIPDLYKQAANDVKTQLKQMSPLGSVGSSEKSLSEMYAWMREQKGDEGWELAKKIDKVNADYLMMIDALFSQFEMVDPETGRAVKLRETKPSKQKRKERRAGNEFTETMK